MAPDRACGQQFLKTTYDQKDIAHKEDALVLLDDQTFLIYCYVL